jgi:hypothetical protein
MAGQEEQEAAGGHLTSPSRQTLSPIRRREFAEPDRADVQESIARAPRWTRRRS